MKLKRTVFINGLWIILGDDEMKKQTSSRNISVVSMLLLAILSFTNACQVNGGYDKVYEDSLDFVRYDSQSNSLWMSEFVGSEILNLELDSGGSVRIVDIPRDRVVTSICTATDIWIGLLDTATEEFSIYRYDRQTAKWKDYHNFETAKCKTLSNGSVVFWSRNKLLPLASDAIGAIISTPYAAGDVSRDNSGAYWLTTDSGEIFQYDNSEGWISKFDALGNSYLFFDTSNYLWVVNYDEVRRYNISNENYEFETLIKTDLGIKQSVFEDRNGTIWVIGTTTIISWNGGVMKEMVLPAGVTLVRFGDYDPSTNNLFLSTDNGIYSLQLDTLDR